MNTQHFSLTEFCDYIVKTHHQYVNKAIPELQSLVEKLGGLEGDKEKVNSIQNLTEKIFRSIKNHLGKEETIAFPIVKYLERCEGYKERPKTKNYKSVSRSAKLLNEEHLATDADLKSLNLIMESLESELGDNNIYKTLNEKLGMFKNDLGVHVHFEDNILFPRAIELEKQLLNIKKRSI